MLVSSGHFLAMADNEQTLPAKILKWIKEEGYPLEYFTANTFRRMRFATDQGDFTHSVDGEPREIDVGAWITRDVPGGGFVRIYNVVECKWTRHKPWVVFTSPSTRKMPSAIIAQTIGSSAAQAAMWANAGNPLLKKLELFSSPESGGFGGRQALSSGQDKFFDCLRSVTAGTVATATGYNREIANAFPDTCVAAFPVIVLDGDLFETHYDLDGDRLDLQPRQHVRCHWRGSGHSRLSTTIDIVTKEGLAAFAEKRATDFEVLADALVKSFSELRAAFDEKKPDLLKVHGAATGMAGPPPLLHTIRMRADL